jgi:hypothetical protein
MGGSADDCGVAGSRWAACLARADVAAAGRLRQVAGIEVCAEGDEIWLRGERLEEDLERRLRAMPGAKRFLVWADGQLQPPGSRVPKGRLPDGPWVPLTRWMGAEFPQTGLAGRLGEKVPLGLVRALVPEEPAVLLAGIQAWAAYAAEAPQVRLDRWVFALASDGRVVVRGRPLPPLPGGRYVEHEGVAVPAGWAWSPPVGVAVLRELLGLAPGDLALWRADGAWERIVAAGFVRASRAAARASAEEQKKSPSPDRP